MIKGERQVQDLIDKLNRQALKALKEGDYDRVALLNDAARQLNGWRERNLVGEMPVSVSHLEALISEKIEIEESILNSQEARIVTPPPDRIEPEPQFVTMLEEAIANAAKGHYNTAIAALEVLVQETRSPALRQEAEGVLGDVRRRRSERLEELLKVAQRRDKQSPNDFEARRQAWERVQALDASNQEAKVSLESVNSSEKQKALRHEIEALKQPLVAQHKDISKVETAMLRAENLLRAGEIEDPALLLELEDVHGQLADLRDDILRSSEGGASNERAKNFEEAIRVYREALDKGYEIIVDDIKGDPINVLEALTRTRSAYREDLKRRASRRKEEAKTALAEGYPETSVARLEKAQQLVRKIDEGGAEVRAVIEDALDKTREELDRKREAQRLVGEAEQASDPREARAKLLQAREIYPEYPHLPKEPSLSKRIAQKEQLILEGVMAAMRADLATAKGAKARAWCQKPAKAEEIFAKAREHCRAALKRGANLEATDETYTDLREEAQLLLEDIEARAQEHSRFMLALDELRSAIGSQDVRKAKAQDRLADDVLQMWRTDERVVSLRKSLVHLQGDQKKYEEAEAFFFQDQDYPSVVELCNELVKESVTFREAAKDLRRRAEARLWLKEGRREYHQGNLEKAQALFKRVEGLRESLPMGDLALCNEAQRELEKIESEKQEAQALRQRFADLQELRQDDEVNWRRWLTEITDLQKESPKWLAANLEKEFDDGTQRWLRDALIEAEKQMRRKSYGAAYEILSPLAEEKLLRDTQDTWRYVRFHYYTQQAGTLLKGTQVAEWERAEEMARDARNCATDSQLKSAQTRYHEVVRETTLKIARFKALDGNPGPHAAVQYLQGQMESQPILKMDAAVRGRLIEYQLDLGCYEEALREARAMAYVETEMNYTDYWIHLVEAARELYDEEYARATFILLQVEERAIKGSEATPQLRALYEHLKNKVLHHLHAVVDPLSSTVKERGLVQRIQALDLIHQLDPSDSQAERDLRDLSSQLPGLIRPLIEKVEELRLRDSLERSLTEGERLAGELDAVLRTLSQVKQDTLTPPLKRAQTDLRLQLERWRSAWRALEKLKVQWARSLGGTWDTEALDDLLEKAQGVGDVKEISIWEERTRILKQALYGDRSARHDLDLSHLVADLKERSPEDAELGLQQLLAGLRQAWDDEILEDFLVLLRKTEERIDTICLELGDERFEVPDNKLSFFDPLPGDAEEKRVAGISNLWQRVASKLENQKQWLEWSVQFGSHMKIVSQDWAEIQEHLRADPPCRSKPLELLPRYKEHLSVLCEVVKAQPQTVRCRRGKQLASQYSPDKVLGGLTDRVAEAEREEVRIREQLEEARAPLEKVRAFIQEDRRGRLRRPLTNRRNRAALRQLIDEVRAVDACHPEVLRCEEVIRMFED